MYSSCGLVPYVIDLYLYIICDIFRQEKILCYNLLNCRSGGMVDARDSKSRIARCESSSLSSGTCTLKHRLPSLCFKVHCVYIEVHDLRHVCETIIWVARLYRQVYEEKYCDESLFVHIIKKFIFKILPC